MSIYEDRREEKRRYAQDYYWRVGKAKRAEKRRFHKVRTYKPRVTHGVQSAKPPDDVLEAARALYLMERPLTAVLMGDPVPGRSALEKRRSA